MLSRHKVKKSQNISGKFTYDYPHHAVATDIAAFTLREGRIEVLLIRRGGPTFEGEPALPGGFLTPMETLDDCARRELHEETGVTSVSPRHFANFSALARDPRERVISIAYFALVPAAQATLTAGTDAKAAEWVPLSAALKLKLAFDHNAILKAARQALADQLWDANVAADVLTLLPAEFTLPQLQSLHEQIEGTSLDRGNFRRKLKSQGLMKLIAPTGRTERDVSKGTAPTHRPSELYRRKRR